MRQLPAHYEPHPDDVRPKGYSSPGQPLGTITQPEDNPPQALHVIQATKQQKPTDYYYSWSEGHKGKDWHEFQATWSALRSKRHQ